ncbi:hypothetical protein ACHAXS_011518 [Conticribra weissflogii]
MHEIRTSQMNKHIVKMHHSERPSTPPAPFDIFSQLEKSFILQIPRQENQIELTGLPKRYEGLSLCPDWSDSPRKKRKLDEVEYPRISCMIAMRWKELATTDLETMRFCEHVAKRKMMEYRSKLIAYNVELIESNRKSEHYQAEAQRDQFKSSRHDVVEDNAVIASTKKIAGVRVGVNDIHQLFRDVDLVDEPRTPSQSHEKRIIATVISPCQSISRQAQGDDHNSLSLSVQEKTHNVECGYVDMTDEEIYEIWYKLFEEDGDGDEHNNTDSARSDHACHSHKSATNFELNRPFCCPCSVQCDDDA